MPFPAQPPGGSSGGGGGVLGSSQDDGMELDRHDAYLANLIELLNKNKVRALRGLSRLPLGSRAW